MKLNKIESVIKAAAHALEAEITWGSMFATIHKDGMTLIECVAGKKMVEVPVIKQEMTISEAVWYLL